MKSSNIFTISPLTKARDLVLEHLYDIPHNHYRSVLVNLVKENNLTHGISSSEGGIILRGRSYVPFKSTNQAFFRLAPHLEEKFADYLKDIKELEIEKRMAKITMSNGFSIIKTREETKSIFGAFIYNLIQPFIFDKEIVNKVAYPGTVQMFVTNHAPYLEQMSERVVSNIIMKGVFDS